MNSEANESFTVIRGVSSGSRAQALPVTGCSGTALWGPRSLPWGVGRRTALPLTLQTAVPRAASPHMAHCCHLEIQKLGLGDFNVGGGSSRPFINTLCNRCCPCPISRPLSLCFIVYQLNIQLPVQAFHYLCVFLLFGP